MNDSSGGSVQLTRHFAASPERVFDAWINPAIACKWLFTSPTSERNSTLIDARVGGAWAITDRREGMNYTVIGEYLEIIRPSRLVFTFGMPQFSPELTRVIVEIAPDGEGSILTLTQEGVEPGSGEAMTDGWGKMFDALATSLPQSGGMATFSTIPCVHLERILPGTIESVWAFLTCAELLPGWFDGGEIEPRLGGKVHLAGGHILGTVTQWSPPHRLTYSWNVYSPGEAVSPYPESCVSFELEAKGEGVRLTLRHLPVLERFERQNAMCWHTFLDMVAAAAGGRPLKTRSEYMRRNAEAYGVDLNNLSR